MRFLPITLAGLLLTGTADAQTPGSLPRSFTASALDAALASKADKATTVSLSMLPKTPIQAELAVQARSLADRFSDALNVRDYGAKCDGRVDDWVPLQDAIDVATGNIAGSTTLGMTQKAVATLAGLQGIGANPNGAASIVVPAGRCRSSHTLIATLRPNMAFSFSGDGSGASELVFPNQGDGMDITFAATPLGNDMSRSRNGPGQAIYVHDLALATGYLGPNTGSALKVDGIRVIASNFPPLQVIRDVVFRNADGWRAGDLSGAGRNEAWSYGLNYTNPDNLLIERVTSIDYTANRTIAFQLNSTWTGGIGHNQIVCDTCIGWGGADFFDVSGGGIQGVFISKGISFTNRYGVSWPAAANSNSGSLVVSDGSIGAGKSALNVTHVGTIFSHDNFYYMHATANNLVAMDLNGVDWVNSTGDTIVLPAAGKAGRSSDGKPYTSTGLVLNQGVAGISTYDGQPSIVSDLSVSGGNVGVAAQGPNVRIQGGVCYATTRCTQDTYTGNDARFHPTFLGMTVNDENTWADDGATAQMFYGADEHWFNGTLDIGMPGVTTPAGAKGYAGNIDFHTMPSTTGIAGLPDYDVRLYSFGGVAGKSGQGTLGVLGGVSVSGGATFDSQVNFHANTIWAASSFPVMPNNSVASLPSRCGAGGMAYATDGRKAGEAAGAGSGVPVICAQVSKGGATAWYSMFSGAAVRN